MTFENVEGKRYPGFGRCIYCGARGDLKDEHIVPLSLGGNAMILKASCGACEKITSYLDGYLARDTFNEYRSHVGLKSRRPKNRPKSLLASFRRPDGSEIVREFSPRDQPYVLLMPIWNVPGIAVSRQASPDFETTQGHLYLFTSPEVHQWISDENLKLGVWPYINYSTFARAIARIAYCQAVSKMGLDGFEPLDLPALILGTYPNVPHYVGVMRDIPPPPDPRNMTHKIELQIFNVADRQYWLASVRLFAHSGYLDTGMPIYRVIVGTPLS